MEAVHEITVWTGVDHQQPNHDYLLDGDKIVAYRPWHTTEIRVLRSGIKIDRRGRKFERLETNPFAEQEEHPDPVILAVPGSKGATYYVNTEDRSCSCPGFTFRGSCKHIKELAL